MIYPNRYISEPRKRKAYEVACDIIYIYGGSIKNFRHETLNIDFAESEEIFSYALKDMKGNSKFDCIYGGKSRCRRRKKSVA